MTTAPSSDLYCPVCGLDVTFITIWQQPDASRLRIFCEDCSHRPEYRDLAKEQRQVLNAEGFRRFAAARQLRNAFEHERARQQPQGPAS